MLENIELTLSVIVTILGLLTSSITFILKFVKSSKAKEKLSNLVKLNRYISGFIEEAEGFIHYSGAEKKAYVMTKVTRFAQVNKMIIDEESVSQKIEELVSLTKQVNVRLRNKKELEVLR